MPVPDERLAASCIVIQGNSGQTITDDNHTNQYHPRLLHDGVYTFKKDKQEPHKKTVTYCMLSYLLCMTLNDHTIANNCRRRLVIGAKTIIYLIIPVAFFLGRGGVNQGTRRSGHVFM